MSTRRMIYQYSVPDIAGAPQTGPLGTIAGRGVTVPVVDCPKAQFGLRSPLVNCLDCRQCEEVEPHFVECGYAPSQQEQAEIKRKADAMAHGGAQTPPTPGVPQQHQGVAMPVPPNVYDPKKK